MPCDAKFPKGSPVRATKVEMLGERVFKLLNNLFASITLFIILKQDDCDFMDVRVGGNTSVPYYFVNYPCQKLPKYLDEFYLFKLSYHFFELAFTTIKQSDRPDFPEYFFHHFMTWSLIFFSYSLNMMPVGAAVMILHDVSDLSVTLFKLTIDWTSIYLQSFTYGSMLVVWMYLRLWYFPGYVIKRIYEECYE